jgi:hypothetical protein
VERRVPTIPDVRQGNEIDTMDSMLIETRGGKSVRRQNYRSFWICDSNKVIPEK